MKVVIGSGPAGIACAHALLAKGESVTMLDAGITLETRPRELLAEVREKNQGALYELKKLSDTPVSGKGVSVKLVYGSDFPYREVREHLGFSGIETGLAPSLARGGFSNVWGAATLPYRQKDLTGWPIRETDLAAHYESVLRITGLSGRVDDLTGMFPLYTTRPTLLESSAQAKRLLAGFTQMRETLRENGIRFGTSRLLVGPSRAQNQSCVYCGQCLYGCPYCCIYNSAEDVRWLAQNEKEKFTYRPDVIVETVVEKNGEAFICGYGRQTKVPIEVECDRAFIAAGVIPSTRIALKSLGAYDHPLPIKDSQYFILPLIFAKGDSAVSREALHTLSQLFLEIEDEAISPYTIHLQVYTYNDLLGKVLRKKMWFAPGLRELLVRPLQNRMIIIQGYLHSDHSGSMSLRLTRDRDTGTERLIVEGTPGVETASKVQQIIRKLARHFSAMNLYPIGKGVDVTQPGRGFHSGGTLPMRQNPAAFETDILGRLPGNPHIHFVDASVFPSIPATTITLTAMANAHRIGSLWSKTSP